MADSPPMLMLRGQLWNIYETRSGERNGEAYDGKLKVQLLVRLPKANGTFQDDFVDLTCYDEPAFRVLLKKYIEVPVGAMAPRDRPGQVLFFAQKGSAPREIEP